MSIKVTNIRILDQQLDPDTGHVMANVDVSVLIKQDGDRVPVTLNEDISFDVRSSIRPGRLKRMIMRFAKRYALGNLARVELSELSALPNSDTYLPRTTASSEQDLQSNPWSQRPGASLPAE